MTHPLFLFVQTASFALLTGRELAKTRFEEAHFAQAAGAMNLWVLDEDLCIARLFFWVLTFTVSVLSGAPCPAPGLAVVVTS